MINHGAFSVLSSEPKQSTRIGARLPPDVLRTLHCAADLTGATLSQFLVQAALKEAQVVIEHEQRLRLSPRDTERLLDLLEHPPLPNSALAAAQSRYETLKRNADSASDWPA
ncbi:hypothetical protein Thi970DRAFT_03058 [Thiorhodovibrio frisius]|uniref:DUF1778 domain-containing protein n=1 Tax=Thiorhodovibrio frisius TaxID=631362 RepID=H8Z303_9GAMM|nr:hypothetical protein Thi970DRAFT_03058 [Thiorhodovibrio frisius]